MLPDYEAAWLEAWQRNIANVPDEIDTPGMALKIENYRTKTGCIWTVDEIRAEILRNPMVAVQFAKDPGKQGIHQTTAARYLSELPHELVQGFKKLASAGRDTRFVIDGAVIKGRYLPREERDVKSLDFFFRMPLTRERDLDLDVYVGHKYTKADGGAQENQFLDLRHQMVHAAKSNDPRVLFLMIADGNFYNLPISERGTTFLETLQSVGNGRNAFALTIDQIEPFLRDYRAWRLRTNRLDRL